MFADHTSESSFGFNLTTVLLKKAVCLVHYLTLFDIAEGRQVRMRIDKKPRDIWNGYDFDILNDKTVFVTIRSWRLSLSPFDLQLWTGSEQTMRNLLNTWIIQYISRNVNTPLSLGKINDKNNDEQLIIDVKELLINQTNRSVTQIAHFTEVSWIFILGSMCRAFLLRTLSLCAQVM